MHVFWVHENGLKRRLKFNHFNCELLTLKLSIQYQEAAQIVHCTQIRQYLQSKSDFSSIQTAHNYSIVIIYEFMNEEIKSKFLKRMLWVV